MKNLKNEKINTKSWSIAACTSLLLLVLSSVQTTLADPIFTLSESAPVGSTGEVRLQVGLTAPAGELWSLLGFGIGNSDAFNAFSNYGWGATILDQLAWDSGLTFTQSAQMGDDMELFTTGAGGVGTFNSIFDESKAAIYWIDDYFDAGIVANGINTMSGMSVVVGGPSSQDFYFNTILPQSNVFGILSGANGTVCLTGPAGVDSSLDSCGSMEPDPDPNRVPLPSTLALFTLGIVIFGLGRRRKS